MPESFWLGWYILLSVFALITLAIFLVAGVRGGGIWGLILGFGSVALITWGLSIEWTVYLIIAAVVIGFFKLELIHERAIYKWTNGRPPGEP